MTDLLTRLNPFSGEKDATKVPGVVADRIVRGRERKDEKAPARTLSLRFWRGDQYWYLNDKGVLAQQTAGGAGMVVKGAKEPHRVREPHNLIFGVVEGKVSAATQRTPGYQVLPSAADQDKIGAARVAQKVALYGYDKWAFQRVRAKVVTYAVVAEEGFAFPYFDTSVGPYRPEFDPDTGEPVFNPDGSPSLTGRGEVRVKTFGPNEVYWEPGCDFYDSRWHATEQAVEPSEIENIPGFYGFPLKPDADTESNPAEKKRDRLVLLTNYFERPSPQFPEGRWLRIANKRQVCPEESFPCLDPAGSYCDEPPLHYLSYVVDPDADRDRGLVSQLIPAQRTYNDCWNKLVEWKNRCLNPQMTAPRGSQITPKKDDTPGAIFYYNPVSGNLKPEWEQPPAVPQELFQMLAEAKQEIQDIAAQTDVNVGPNVAARTAQAAIENDQNRWQSFIASLAEFDSRLMRHCLYLVARHYDEPRLIQINGDFGADPIEDFTGAQLMDQCDVRVYPDSITPQTRDSIEAKIFAYADRGWISPTAAMAAINGGTAEALARGYELDVGRAFHIIQLIKKGPGFLFNSFRPRMDPETGEEIPGWMPRPFDDLAVHRTTFESWMKTPEWDQLPQPMQEAALQYYDAVLQLQVKQQLQAQQLQVEQAAQQGMQNAAKLQGASPVPSNPAPTGPIPEQAPGS